MKESLFLLSLCSSVFIHSGAFSQVLYSSPEPKGSEPVSVRKSDAIAEASSLSGACGYSRAYLSTADLQGLLNTSSAVGLRIYNAKETADQKNCDIVTVAVDANGKEVGPVFGNKYLHAESYDVNTSCPSSKISKTKASGCVSTVANSNLNYQKVFFSRSLLETRFRIDGSTGITIIPGEINGGSTMMVMAAKLDNGTIVELEDSYLKSQLPCPTDCGDSGNYLVAPK
ncbi:MAG: hypothetical protein EP314_03975 [Bacteroidetes bacterium]|nr:MAG: hypothetical protein EP314_03975 [Bacteroidota bacterium]